MVARVDKPVFKIAAGGQARDHSRVFLDQDLAAIGPGGPGPWSPDAEDAYEGGDRTSLKALSQIRKGDLVVMTNGYSVRTVGRVIGEYAFDEHLGLVGGWDLFHFVRVKWADWREEDVQTALDRDTAEPLKVRRRACRLGAGSKEVIEWANRLDGKLESSGYWLREPMDLKANDRELDRNEIERYVPKDRYDEFWNVVTRAGRLWGEIDWSQGPSENEAVALLTVPLLLALGWDPESIALEWHRVDVAVFDGQRDGENCRLLIEAKRPGSGLSWAQGQAFEYAKDEKRQVVSNHATLPTSDQPNSPGSPDRLPVAGARRA